MAFISIFNMIGSQYNTEFYHEEYGGNVNTEIEISLLNHGQKRV